MLLITACYETDQEVIHIDQGAAVDGLVGDYSHDGSTMTTEITAVAYSNDYRYRRVDEDGSVTTGLLRAMPLKDTIYLVQIFNDGATTYTLTFYDFRVGSDGSKTFERMIYQAPDAAIHALAEQHGVEITEDEFVDFWLSGNSENMMSFLLAHRDFPFVSDEWNY